MNDDPQICFFSKYFNKLSDIDINRLKELQPDQYKSIYLGFPANLGGGCYKSFNLDRNIKPATHKYIDITIGVDFGGNDATVATAVGWLPNFKGIEVIDTYYHKNGVTGGVKNINEYAKDIMEFCEKIFLMYERPLTMYLDSANNTTIGMLLEDYCMTQEYAYVVMGRLNKLKKRKGTNKQKSAIQERIDVAEIMFAADYLTIDNSQDRNEELVTALQEAQYDKNGNRLDNDTVNVDSLDSLEYAWIMEMDFIYDMILSGHTQQHKIDANSILE